MTRWLSLHLVLNPDSSFLQRLGSSVCLRRMPGSCINRRDTGNAFPAASALCQSFHGGRLAHHDIESNFLALAHKLDRAYGLKAKLLVERHVDSVAALQVARLTVLIGLARQFSIGVASFVYDRREERGQYRFRDARSVVRGVIPA